MTTGTLSYVATQRILSAILAMCCFSAAAACGETVDPAGLPSTDGYETWDMLAFTNPVPGHGDSYRQIFINPVARSYPHGGRYPVGSVIVKEIYDKTDNDGRGDLRYIAVMRKVIDEDDHVEGGDEDEIDAPIDGGWVFTQIKGGGDEKHLDLCWGQCHVQAPYDGAFFDYGY